MVGLAAAMTFHLLAASQLAAEDFTPPPLQVPEGFTVELAAAPPLVKHPMMACFDERGRLFIAESSGNNLEKEDLLKQRGRFIRMLEDTDDDGKFDKSTIFADKLVMPEGALWHQGALFVLSSPYLWRLEDTDGDGVADKRDKLVGYMELNGKANQHGAYLGPNGRLYFSGGIFGYDLVGTDGKRAAKGTAAGVFSCRPDGGDVEVFGNGGINPVEVVFTPAGELITTCPIFDSVDGRHDALIHWVRGATAGPKDYNPPVLKQTGYRLPALSRWGQVAPSGLTRYRSTAWGDEFKDTLFATQFNTARVMHTRIERMGATFRSHDKVFLSSTSTDFHPTDVFEDADGSLLVIDTGGWFRISCPQSKVAKPNILGAIYRIRRTGVVPTTDPRGLELAWTDAPSPALVRRLDDPRPVVRDRAIELLAARSSVSELAAGLESESAQLRRNAIWSLSRIASPQVAVPDVRSRRSLESNQGSPTSSTPQAIAALRRGLRDEDLTVRQATVRSVGVLRDGPSTTHLIEILTGDDAPSRRAAATALGQIGASAAVEPLLRSVARGGDDFLMHAHIYALIEIGDFDETLKGLASANPRTQHAALTALDQMAPAKLKQSHVARLLESNDLAVRQATLRIVTAREGWSDQVLGFLNDWSISSEPTAAESRLARGAIIAFGGEAKTQELLRNALASRETAAAVNDVILTALARMNDVPDLWVEPLEQILLNGDAATQLKAIGALDGQPSSKLDKTIARLATDANSTPALRVAAWSCLARRGLPLPASAFGALRGRILDSKALPFERLDAARALAAAKLSPPQQRATVELVSRVGPLELPPLLAAVERIEKPDRELGHRLVSALERSSSQTAISPAQLRDALANFSAEVRDSAQPLIMKISVDDAKKAARLRQVEKQLTSGNAAHGKLVFFSNRAACGACHRVQGEGGVIGPDLSRIGRVRRRVDLLESILFPSSTLVNEYETFSVVTRDGRTHQGVIQHATPTAIVLRNAQREETEVARADIEEIARSKTSIMPQGLEQTIRLDELSDLLAYLQSLK
jgi:putative membrane-bound dehydrogenase-like protein